MQYIKQSTEKSDRYIIVEVDRFLKCISSRQTLQKTVIYEVWCFYKRLHLVTFSSGFLRYRIDHCVLFCACKPHSFCSYFPMLYVYQRTRHPFIRCSTSACVNYISHLDLYFLKPHKLCFFFLFKQKPGDSFPPPDSGRQKKTSLFFLLLNQ